jgi:hypothetical protein
MKFDRDKLKALVLYVIWRAGQQEGFGATKINKVLWFADARRYEVFGQSITGETYVRQPHGPVPQHIDEIKRELESDGSIKGWSETYYDKSITGIWLMRHPTLQCSTLKSSCSSIGGSST